MNIPDISHPALEILVAHEPHLLLDEKGTPDINHITEELALELKPKLKGLQVSISDIEGLKSRFVLLIGSDDDLLDAVAAYIYCLRSVDGCTGLYYQSFRGKPDDYLANELTTKYIFKNDTTIRQYEAIANKEGSGTKVSTTGASTGYPKTMDGDLLGHIKQGRSVFLGDLKYPNSLLLEGLGKKIASIKTHWERYQTDKRGLLIVSTLSEKDLPAYFVKRFEVIDFNPKQAQSTPEPLDTEGKPQATTQKQGIPTKKKQIKELFYTYNENDKITLSSSQSSNSKHVPITLTEQEGKLVLFLDEDRRTLDEIIGHIWEVFNVKDVRKKRTNARELRNRVNKECAKLGVETLISEQTDGYYQLTVELEDY